MDELFYHLEVKIKALVQQCEFLKQTNSKLRQSKSLLIREKEQLLAKHNIAITHIESMVSRLKTIEKSQ